MQSSAAWSAAAAAVVVVVCVAASGQGAVIGQRNKKFMKGWKFLPTLELDPFDHRCANRISTWRKISDVWRKRCTYGWRKL